MKKIMKKAVRTVYEFFQSEGGRRFAALSLTALCAGVQAFAQDAAATLNTTLYDKVSIILNIIGSPWVKGVACIALVAECIGMITAGRQEPGMFKKFVPWVAGTLLFLAAGTITSVFMNDLTSTTFSDILKK
jgi:type IV secretory pathway VirB2 component (pilin)